MGLKIKYNRTSTIQQEGERFKLDKDSYDLTLFDKGVSGKIPFSEREKGRELTQLVQNGEVDEVVVEELSRLGRNTIDTLTTLKFFEENGVNVVVKSMGNLQSSFQVSHHSLHTSFFPSQFFLRCSLFLIHKENSLLM